MPILQEVSDRAGKTRWRLTDPVRYMLRGAAVMLAVVALLVLALGARIVWVRAYNGQAAYEYIQQAIAAQQAQQQKAIPPTK